MSTYENYNKTSGVYDNTRSAAGVEIIHQALRQSSTPIEEQRLVDAGCGTGLFSFKMLSYVKRIEAIDLNSEMLSKAKDKMVSEEAAGRISFYNISIDDLPFDNESVDSIMVNQVLHHLPENKDGLWSNHYKVFNEFSRVLKPTGTLIINRSTHEQMQNSFWFYNLIPKALKLVIEKHIDTENLFKHLKKNGFGSIEQKAPLDVIMQGNELFNVDGPFDPQWRRGDSIWSLVSDDDLNDVLEFISALKKSSKLEEYIQDKDRSRLKYGQITFTIARKIL